MLLNQMDTMVASSTSAAATAGLAMTGTVPTDDPATWIPWALTTIGPVVVLVAKRAMAAKAARDRSLAESKAAEAARLRADNDPSNDSEAAKLEREAAADRAAAAAWDAGGKDAA